VGATPDGRTPDAETARRLDAADPLAAVRKDFVLPEGVVYLDGNSLGALAARVPDRIGAVVREQWGEHLIRAWNDDGWWTAPLRVGDRIGRLIGAAPGQTVVGDSTSVQVFNSLVGAARLRPQRPVLITDPEHFPTDRYLAGSAARLLGLELLDVPVGELQAALRRHGDEVAVVAYPVVDYRTGELWDVPAVTAAAHDAGALVLWDLCHAAGAVPLRLDADGVDLAVGCTYKYLSGGPGAPAYSYVAARHQAGFDPPLTGWTGHADPFGMPPGYRPAAGIGRARIGTPPILSLSALDAALDAFDGIDLDAVRAKSLSLGDFFLSCVDGLLAGLGFDVVTPREPARRGSQVTLRHPDAYPMMAALVDRGVIGDVRPPGLLRFGFNALYVAHADIYTAVRHLRDLALSGEYRDPRFRIRKVVT
jgi:kynureninase